MKTKKYYLLYLPDDEWKEIERVMRLTGFKSKRDFIQTAIQEKINYIKNNVNLEEIEKILKGGKNGNK